MTERSRQASRLGLTPSLRRFGSRHASYARSSLSGASLRWRWRESTLRSEPSWLLAPGRGKRSRRHPWRLDRASLSDDRAKRGALSRSVPATPHMREAPFRELLFVGGGGSRTRVPGRAPRTSTGLSVLSSCRGWGSGAARLPSRIPECVPRAVRSPRGASLGQLRAARPLEAAQSRARRSSALTRRERDCRCCWQLKFCRIRRSAAPPAARDPDRSGRDRCTPL